jgi:type I restriction enzyme M protein
VGRAAIIENGSPLFTGGTASGESQIRRWLLEQDLIEAIIAMPTDLFYNTGIATYIWVLSKNKRPERVGKVQLIDATGIFHKLRKPLGNKKNEFSPEDRATITRLYADFREGELVKIFPNTEFIYREYTVMQPLQRSFGFTEERIERMLQAGALKSLWDDAKVAALEEQGTTIAPKDKKELDGYHATRPVYDAILEKLRDAACEQKWLSLEAFMPVLTETLAGVVTDKKLLDKIADGLSVMDKEAVIQRETKGRNKGAVIYDKASKDTEIVRWDETIEDYMTREVLPHVPDAQWFWEENVGAKKPVIKTGAEFPFTRYFYKYAALEPSEKIWGEIAALESEIAKEMKSLKEMP